MKKLYLIFTIIFTLFLAACQTNGTIQVKSNNVSTEVDLSNEESKTEGVLQNEDEKTEEENINTTSNENGKIMILMYHGIGQKEEEWVRTADNFRKDLETLYNKGYRLISLNDYINNNIKVEAGFTPVVITFDDGLLNQFNIIQDGDRKVIDPDCAVGIMEEFYKEHSDFGKGASFYVYYPVPFRQKELIKEKFEFLINNGYEIGNHSYDHPNLGKVSIDEVQRQLALNVKNTKAHIPDYEVTSLALPFGAAPKGEDYKYVVSGSYEDTSYNNKAILKVGSNPAPSPNSIDFDPLKLPRVRASELNTAGTGLYDWLNYFDKNPEKRYISDGNPDTITIPESELSNINMDSITGKKLKSYSK